MAGIIEQINSMKQQGISESEIISNLQTQGVSPKEINDALNQSQIKNAIGTANDAANPGEINTEAGMQGSIMTQEYSNTPNPASQQQAEYYAPPQPQQTQEYSQYPQTQQTYNQPAYPETGGYQDYSGYSSYQGQDQYNYGYGSSSMIEVAEQVFMEKIKEYDKKIREFEQFRAISETTLENNTERLKKIESMLEKLQIAILEKVGSYGNNLESIKKEMSMMQDSFQKMVLPITEKSSKKSSRKTSKK